MRAYRIFASRLAMACGLVAVSVSASAHPGDCSPMGSWEQFHEERMERMQQHQKMLHDALKLSPEQEDAWKKFTDSMPPTARMAPPSPEEWRKLTAPERADKMLDLMKQRQERMSEHVAALKSFYAVLTPEQKKTFDAQHPGFRGGKQGPRRSRGDSNKPAAPEQNKG